MMCCWCALVKKGPAATEQEPGLIKIQNSTGHIVIVLTGVPFLTANAQMKQPTGKSPSIPDCHPL